MTLNNNRQINANGIARGVYGEGSYEPRETRPKPEEIKVPVGKNDYVTIRTIEKNKIEGAVEGLEGKSPLHSIKGQISAYVHAGLNETNLDIHVSKLPVNKLVSDFYKDPKDVPPTLVGMKLGDALTEAKNNNNEDAKNFIIGFAEGLKGQPPEISKDKKIAIYNETVEKYNNLSEDQKAQFMSIDRTSNMAMRPLPQVLQRFGAKSFNSLSSKEQSELLTMQPIHLLEPIVLLDSSNKSETVSRLVVDEKTGIEFKYEYTAGFLDKRVDTATGKIKGFYNLA